MRIPISTDLKNRTGGSLNKDAKLMNSYVETKPQNDPNAPPESIVRKRPIAQGGVSTGTGIAQGGIWFNKLYLVSGDVLVNYTGAGTNWNSGTAYVIGDMVSDGFVDYWAINSNSNDHPPSGNWSRTYIPPRPTVPHTYATLDPAHNGFGTLSNGNLTITGGGGTVRSNISKATGKWYWEIYMNTLDYFNSLCQVGIIDDSFGNIGWPGSSAFGYGYTSGVNHFGIQPPLKISGGISSSYGAIYTQNKYVGVAMDLTNGTIEFFVDGASQGVAYTGISGTYYAAIGEWLGSASNVVATFNFGATAFAHSPPSGFNAGLYL